MQTNLPASGFWSSGPEKRICGLVQAPVGMFSDFSTGSSPPVQLQFGKKKKKRVCGVPSKQHWVIDQTCIPLCLDALGSTRNKTRRHWFGSLNSCCYYADIPAPQRSSPPSKPEILLRGGRFPLAELLILQPWCFQGTWERFQNNLQMSLELKCDLSLEQQIRSNITAFHILKI